MDYLWPISDGTTLVNVFQLSTILPKHYDVMDQAIGIARVFLQEENPNVNRRDDW